MNAMTAIHSRTYSVRNVVTTSQDQQTVLLQRSYTCKSQHYIRSQRNLSVRHRKVYSTPSTPSMRSNRKLSCQSFLSESDGSDSRKSSVLSLGEKISSLLSIPRQVHTYSSRSFDPLGVKIYHKSLLTFFPKYVQK